MGHFVCGDARLPWMFGVEAHIGIRVKNGRAWEPAVGRNYEGRPRETVLLTAAPKPAANDESSVPDNSSEISTIYDPLMSKVSGPPL